MLIIRAMAAAAVVTGMFMLAETPAFASCENMYSPSCKPIPMKDPPADVAVESSRSSKPLQLSRRGAARKARAERSAQTQRKRFARGSTTEHVLVLRQRRGKAATASRERVRAPIVAEDDEESKPLPPTRSRRGRRAVTSADPGALNGEATDLGAGAPLQAQTVVTIPITVRAAVPAAAASVAAPAPAAMMVAQAPAGPAPTAQALPPQAAPQPAATAPVRTVSQNEINEIDLAAAAAAPEAADQSWMRTLVLAFGGLLAVGSAVRLFL